MSADHRAGEPPATRIVFVERSDGLGAGLDALGLRRGRPVVVLVGGAGGMAEGDRVLAGEVVRRSVFPLLDRLGAVVVDGGTDAGVMRVAGRARAACGGRFPLVGVVARGTVAAPGSAGPDAEVLEPFHTHVVLVPGSEWGDESPWLAEVASAIADGAPTVTLVVNGGAVTYDDIARSLGVGRPVVVLGGTGRAADEIAAAAAGRAVDARAAQVAASPLTSVVDSHDHHAVTAALASALASRP
jgi:TRPM family ion channel